jgi:hypothetical protein
MPGAEIIVASSDYCQASTPKTQGFGLEGPATARKPVLILDGYGGNHQGDAIVHQSMSDTMPWARENFRVVQIPPGANVTQAQQTILRDRQQNPQDYGANSHVTMIMGAHGYVDQNGQHRTVRSDVSNQRVVPNQVGPTEIATSYRTVDRVGALMEGVGHRTGTVTCALYQCQSGQVVNDPNFPRLQTSSINPQQQRVFQFSSQPNRVAMSSTSVGPDGRLASGTPIEQSVGFLMQQAQPGGLTVAEYQRRLAGAQLGNVNMDVQTAFVPGGDSTGPTGGLGTPSHMIATPLFSPQQATVVGPKDAYILPPGVRADTHNPPVANMPAQNQAIQKEFPNGTTFRDPVDVGAGPYEAPVGNQPPTGGPRAP